MSIASFLLVVMLVFIGYIISKGQSEKEFPPVVPKCPDYWTITEDGKSCVNTLGLGSCNSESTVLIDDPARDWNGSSGLKNKCEWAKGCNLTWDGITNNGRIDC
tara:strand:+ start:7791 stop:8102 length:312 start_codon:yes stop_codon:yes gene_type:complete